MGEVKRTLKPIKVMSGWYLDIDKDQLEEEIFKYLTSQERLTFDGNVVEGVKSLVHKYAKSYVNIQEVEN